MMLATSLHHRLAPKIPVSKRLFIQIVSLLGGAALLLFAPPLVARFSPFLAVLLAWLWFMLPGYILSLVLVKKLFWAERLPLAFVLTLGIGTPYTVLAILLRMRLDHYVGLSALAVGLVLLIFLFHRLRQRSGITPEIYPEEITNKLTYGHVIYTLMLMVGIGAMALVSSQWPPAGDDLAGLPHFSEVLRLGQITGTEPFHGSGTPVTPRNELIVWGYQTILVNKISGASSIDALQNNRPIFILLSFLAFFTFLRRYFKNDHLALFILSLWGVYLLATMQADGMGSNLLTRIIQDKFVGWFVVVPVILVLMLWVLESGQFRYLIAFAIGALGATLLHPITLSTILLLSSSFGLFYILFETTKKALLRTLLVGLVLALCLLIPIYQYYRFTSPMPVDLAGMRDAVEYGRLTMAVGRYRLWLLENDRYILHPSIVLQPVVLIGYALTPFLIPLLHRSNAARLLLGTTIFLPLYLYFPPLAILVGKFVTPYLLWRLAWPIPALAVIVIGWSSWSLARWLARLFQGAGGRVSAAVHYGLSFSLVMTAIFVTWPQIKAGQTNLFERYQVENFATCAKAQTAMAFLDQLVEQPANVLASRSLNFCIPGYAALANVVEFRGYGTLNRLDETLIPDSLQRVVDVSYFSVTEQVDDLIIAMLERWDIKYIVLETARIELNFQMQQMENLFVPIYADRDIAIYAIARPVPTIFSIDGFTAIRLRHWDEAEAIFTRIIEEDANPGLAYFGLGIVQEGQGNLEQSLNAYLAALRYVADQPAIHFQLAGTYLLLHDAENAIQFYQQAVMLAPQHPALHSALGLAYQISGQSELARSSYADAAALQAVPGTAVYYSLLGDLMVTTNWPIEAANHYRAAIAIDPSSVLYAKLAQALVKLGDWQGAIEADEQAIVLDAWASAPHQHLGSIYLYQGQEALAIQEFELAWRLNPTNTLAAVSLASAIQKIEGIDKAVARMQALLSLNRLLPGPHRGLDTLYRSAGESEAALQELNWILSIQLNDPSITSILGDFARDSENYLEAERYYNEALLLNPGLPSARMGISYLYGRATEYGPQLGQYLMLARDFPSAAWPHYLLASHFKNRGSLDIALAETRRALSMEPQNASGYVMLGDIYRSRGEYEWAVEPYQLAIALQPDLADAYLNLASTYTSLDQPELARSILETALEHVLEIAPVRTALGDLFLASRDFAAATLQYGEAIAFNDTFLDAYIGLSRTYLLMSDPDASRNALQVAAEKVPDDFTAYDLLADFEIARGNPEAAIQWLQNGIQANPQASTGYVNLGDEYRRLGWLDKAIESYQQALAMDDQTVAAYLNLAAIYDNLGNYQSAEEIFLKLIERVPYSNTGYLSLGNLYLKMGNLAQAETIYRAALSIPPLSPSLYLALSNLYILRADWETALAIRETIYQELPTSGEAALNLANIYRQTGDFENAQRVYERLLAVNQSVPAVYLGLAQLAQLQGETETAREWLVRSLSSTPKSVEACLNLANFHEAQGEIEEAELLFQRTLDLDPFNNANYIALGQFYLRQGQFDEALQVLEKGLVIPPNTSGLYLTIGDVYLALQQPEDALHWYQAAIALNDGDIAPYLTIARFHQDRLQWDQALESLQSALLKQPGNAFVHLSLGNIYKINGRYEEAAAEFQSACTLEPLRTDCRIALGNLFASAGQWAEAIDQYRIAVQLAPTELSTYATLARTYLAAGMISQATQTYSQAITNNPGQPAAWLARAAYFVGRQSWEQALIHYHAAWQRFPDDQETGRQLAQFYRQRGDWEAAREILTGMLSLPDVEAATYIALGDLYTQRTQWEAAMDAYQQAIQQDPTAHAAYTGLAYVYLLQDRTEDALDINQAAVFAMPENWQAYLTLGDAYLARLDYSAAQAAYEKASALSAGFNTSAFTRLDNLFLKMNPEGIDLTPLEAYARSAPNASIYATVAYRYQLRAEWQTALGWYQEALALEPNNGAVWLALGNYHRIRQDWQAAFDALENAVQYTPSASALVALGAVQEALKLPEDALATYYVAAEMDRSLISPYLSIAKLYASQGQYDLAEDFFYQGLQASPGDASGYEALGQFYLAQGETKLAMDTFQAGLHVIPGAVSLLIGQAGFMGDQLVEAQDAVFLAQSLQSYAEDQLDRAIGGADPHNIAQFEAELVEAEALLTHALTEYHSALTTYEAMIQDLETAEAYYKKALQIQPANVFALVGLADLYRDFNRPDEALANYEQAVATNPSYVMALNALGNAYLADGRVADALQVFERALRYSPNNLGTFYGMLAVYDAIGELSASTSADSIRYSQYWWVYYLDYFRQSEASRLAQ